jgi:hypothetical protein
MIWNAICWTWGRISGIWSVCLVSVAICSLWQALGIVIWYWHGSMTSRGLSGFLDLLARLEGDL